MVNVLLRDTDTAQKNDIPSEHPAAVPPDLLAPFVQIDSGDNPTVDPDPAAPSARERIKARPTPVVQVSSGGPSPAPIPQARGPRLERIPTHAIQPHAALSQRRIDLAELKSLSAVIKRNGLASPLLVRVSQPQAKTYELFAGYRRWRAAIEAGIPLVPVIIFESLSEAVALELGVLDNMRRRDPTIIEEAETFRVLAERFGRTPDQIAALSGRTRNQVANMLCLAALPDEVRARLRTGQISYAHGRALLDTPDPASLAERIAAERLTVRETELLAARLRLGAGRRDPCEERSDLKVVETDGSTEPHELALEKPAPRDVKTLQAALSIELGAPVEVRAGAEGSNLTIMVQSPEEAGNVAGVLCDALRLLRMNRRIDALSQKLRVE